MLVEGVETEVVPAIPVTTGPFANDGNGGGALRDATESGAAGVGDAFGTSATIVMGMGGGGGAA